MKFVLLLWYYFVIGVFVQNNLGNMTSSYVLVVPLFLEPVWFGFLSHDLVTVLSFSSCLMIRVLVL